KKTSEKSEVFTLFAISSSAVPLYADELEMTKSASFSTALTSLSIFYRQAKKTEGSCLLFFYREIADIRKTDPYFLAEERSL
ncbi:MAG: hypothetical protein IJ046_04865, partial [Clostridia bacterium]|nr:hypothetical protein [Clostridia bacterium]